MLSRIITAALALLLSAAVCMAADWSVVDFGAVGDGVADNTAAFQKALNQAGEAGGGVVSVPAGRYLFNGTLSIPRGVTLQGTYRVPPLIHGKKTEQMHGSVLLAYAGRGSEEGEPFIRLAGDSSVVSGLIVIYPECDKSDVPPVPYPPCVASENTENVGILDCLFLNPYEAIKLVRGHRSTIRNIHGYPIKRGLYIDQCYDIGRVENIHFWPFGVTYRHDDPYCKWINVNGVAFEFARTDWHYVTNTFCFGYGVGYKFSETQHGSCNGNFLGIGADSCRRAVLVDQCQSAGLLITNGEFVGRWGSTDSVCLEIGENVRGKVSLSNCSFWGPIDRCVWSRSGQGQFTATGCNFVDWDNTGCGSAAVQIDAGKAIVQGCTFGDGTCHIQIGEDAASAIIMGNQAPGGLLVDNRAGKKTRLAANEENPVVWTDEAKAHYRLTIGAGNDNRYLRRWHGPETMPTDSGAKPFRWSSGSSDIVVPVLPGTSYDVCLELTVPDLALASEAGLYLGDQRIAAIEESGAVRVSAAVPESESDILTLTLRCSGWVPAENEEGSRDTRTLGVQAHAVTVRAKEAPTAVFDANTGQSSK